MNKSWAVVEHVSFEGPALIGTLLAGKGIRHIEYPMYRARELPSVHDIGGLVVMGGPMGALDDVTHPQLPRERNFIKEIVDAGLPMLGICLGAQLLAASFGSAIRRGPSPENGPGTVTVSEDGTRDPVFGSVGAEVPVVHWHGDTFDLPDGAIRLAGVCSSTSPQTDGPGERSPDEFCGPPQSVPMTFRTERKPRRRITCPGCSS
jgi:GMP synthase-like glutamine amidotransferase